MIKKKFVRVKAHRRTKPKGTYKVVDVKSHMRCRPRKGKKCGRK
jgi:hypothetical protein